MNPLGPINPVCPITPFGPVCPIRIVLVFFAPTLPDDVVGEIGVPTPSGVGIVGALVGVFTTTIVFVGVFGSKVLIPRNFIMTSPSIPVNEFQPDDIELPTEAVREEAEIVRQLIAPPPPQRNLSLE